MEGGGDGEILFILFPNPVHSNSTSLPSRHVTSTPLSFIREKQVLSCGYIEAHFVGPGRCFYCKPLVGRLGYK